MFVREIGGAWRRLAARPGYVALSVCILGVGLGLVLFLFSIVNSLILQPLPFAHADRLMAVGEPASHGIEGIDSSQYLQLQGKLRSVDLIGAYDNAGVNLDGGSGATYYPGCVLTASMMKMLEVQPLLGRGFEAADDQPGAPRVVLLGEALWRNALHADPHVIGRAVRVNGEWATVVGVMPASFRFPARSQAWLPLRMAVGEHTYVDAVARLAPGRQLGQARAELDAWAGRLQRALPPGAAMQAAGYRADVADFRTHRHAPLGVVDVRRRCAGPAAGVHQCGQPATGADACSAAMKWLFAARWAAVVRGCWSVRSPRAFC